MPEVYVFGESDIKVLKDFLAHEGKWRHNERPEDPDPYRPDGTPDQYVARVPCKEYIPARVGIYPGHRECCIFKTYQPTLGAAIELRPVLNPDGTHVRRDVFNIYEEPIYETQGYIRIRREKFGRWLAPLPIPGATTTTQALQIINVCWGQCDFIWDATNNYWTLNINGCGSTTTPDPATTTSTTTSECLCPPGATTTDDPASTSSTTTSSPTTTTTPRPCNCLYPNFCGTSNGQHTQTFCTDQVQVIYYYGPGSTLAQPNHPCPPTTTTSTSTTTSGTTTTCDCATTTSAPSDCSAPHKCTWAYMPTGAGGSFQWQLKSNTCSAQCPCQPPSDPGAPCEEKDTPCIVPTPVPPTACKGECTYWGVEGVGWILTDNLCNGGTDGAGCGCTPPSATPTGCAPAKVPCVSPNTPTTAALGPCAACYSTQPPITTTTCAPCSKPCSKCKWQYSTSCGQMVLVENTCSGDCGCFSAPFVDPAANWPDGSVVETDCDANTTTTAAPTTTTTGTASPCNSYCAYRYSPDCGGWALAHNPCAGDCPTCPDPPASPGFPNQQLEIRCAGTTTTTTAGPTTTTTCPPTTTTTTSTTTGAPTTTTVCLTTTTAAATTTTCAPGFAPNLTGAAVDGAGIRIDWTAPVSPGTVVTYKLYRFTPAGGGIVQFDSVASPALTYLDTTGISGESYHYWVTAVLDCGGESPFSNQSADIGFP